ncbi:MAG: laccase domain-containing protein [Agathobacter rectalis]
MNREFGTEAHDVIAAIGPSICQDCYEISQDVAEHFVDEFATTDDPHASDILLYKGDGKYQLNLWECNRRVLVEAGVQEDNIAISNICTCCNPLYFRIEQVMERWKFELYVLSNFRTIY